MSDTDLLIIDDDIALEGIGEPGLATERTCIAQDIAHMIREKGYAVEMVGERGRIARETLISRIEMEMEEDARIVPGTARVEYLKDGVYYATGDTVAYGPVSVSVVLNRG